VEEDSTCPDGEMRKLDDKEKNMMLDTPCPKDVVTNEEEEGTKLSTLKTKTDYYDANNTPREIGFTQYVLHKDK
jgi:hypothetical protein